MIKNRDEFFGMLWEDYISFDEKERDKYILLKSAYLAMERYEVMTEEEYVGILKELIGNSVPKKYRELCGREAVVQAEEALERRFLIGCVRICQHRKNMI